MGVIPYINGVHPATMINHGWKPNANMDDPPSYLSSGALPPETSRDNCHGQTSGERGFLVAWARSTCVPAAVVTPIRGERARSKEDTGQSLGIMVV